MAQSTSSQTAALNWEQFLGRIDRRYLYAGLFIFTLLPLVFHLSLPVYVTPPVQNYFNAVEALPQDKMVLVSSNWDAGTYAENEPQTIGLFRQLLRRRLKFVIMSANQPNAPQLAQNNLEEAIRQEFPTRTADGYPLEGRDYVNTGMKLRNSPWIRSLVRDPVTALGSSWKGKPLKAMPMFAGGGKLADRFSMLADVTASNTIDAWVALVGPEGIQITLGCTAVMAPEQYPLLSTGQLAGMLTGMRGAAEYEKLLGIAETGRATRMMGGQSFAHLYLFLLIGLGNFAIIRGLLRRRAA